MTGAPLRNGRLRVLLGLALLAYLPSCNSGLAALVGASSSDSSGSTNTPPSVAGLGVSDARTSPARVGFTLIDGEGDPASVALAYQVAGGPPVPLALAAGEPGVANLTTSSNGTEHERLWDFASQLGPGFQDEVSVTVEVLGAGGVQQTVLVEIGNDAPELANLVVPRDEVTGVVLLDVEVLDSSSDLVEVVVEYDVVGDDPDLGFRSATAAGTGSGPVAATPEGTLYTFFWDVREDLGFAEELIDLRLSGTDGELTSEAVLGQVAIDNNQAPIALLDVTNFGNNQDRQRGIPLGFRIFDGDLDTGEPADEVQIVFQWAGPSGSFPTLPSTVAGIEAALADPELREELQLATELPLVYEGLATAAVSEPAEADTARLPELLTSAFSALRIDPNTRAASLHGELEILRGRRTPASLPRLAGLFRNPIGAVPRAGTDHFLVLEGTGGGWRLREVDPARGTFVGLDVSGIAPGTTTAMAREGSDGSVLVASDNAGSWHVQRAGPGGVTDLISADGSTETGTVRGIVALGTEAAILSVGNSLLRLSYPPGETPSAHPLAIADGALQAPWGLAFDRDRDLLYVAEHGADRLLEIHLPTLRRRVLAAPGPGLPAPEAIALENGNSRLLVVTDANPSDGLHELRALDLGDPGDLDGDGLADPEAFEILPGPALDEALPDAVGGVSSGAEHLRLVALPSANDVLVGGGVEQTRTITGYDHATQTVRVSPDFDPPFEAGQPARPWRLAWTSGGRYRAAPEGASGTFLWDCRDTDLSDVQFRIVPFDSDFGAQSTTTQPRTVFPYFGGESEALGGPTLTERPAVVRAADLDGDGDLDVVSGNTLTTGGVSVFFQTDPGDFAPGVLLGSPTDTLEVRDIEPADLDGDGDLDLAIESERADDGGGAVDRREVSVLFQTAPGVFTAPVQIATPAQEVAVADFDGDGDADLAVQSLGPPVTLDLYLQDPPGVFTTRLVLDEYVFTGTGSPRANDVQFLEAEDVDGDGDVDLWFTSAEGVSAYEQTTPGVFALRPPVPLAWPLLDAEDVDLDGDVDLILAEGDGLGLLLQTAPWTFGPGPSISLDDPDTSAGPLAFADLDGDGDLDLVLGHDGVLTLSVLLQYAPGEFEVVSKLNPQAASVGDVEVADVDGDGVPDVLSANGLLSTVSVHFARPHRDFALGPNLSDQDLTPNPQQLDQGDLDGDGDLDIVVASGSGAQLTVFDQTAPGVYQPGVVLPTPNSAIRVRVADLDQDADLDLICSTVSSLMVFFRAPDGTFVPQPPLLTPDGGSMSDLGLGDLDGDGRLDLIALVRAELSDGTSFSSVVPFHQESTGTFGRGESALQVLGSVTRFVVVDLDADGDLDMALSNPVAGTIQLFLQSGPGQFVLDSALPSATPGLEQSFLVAGDFDGNGRIDLLVGGRSSTGFALDLSLQGPGGEFAPPRVAGSVFGPGWVFLNNISVADIDADGDLDFAISFADFVDGGGVGVLVQRRPGVFEREPTLGPTSVFLPNSVLLADFDSDGDVDFAFSDAFGGDLLLYFGSH